jgi:hypothetical protein
LVTPSVHAVAQPRAIDQAVQTIRTLRIHLGNSKAAWPIVMAQLTGDSASFPCVHGGSIMQGRPVLTKWLAGAHAAHPLLRPEMPDWFLDTLELIVAPVDAVEPLRLPTKMKAFRTLTTDAELLEQRAELLIGSMIARSGVPFEFGKDHPDYVLGEQALGIEVGSRALDGPWALHDRLEELLAESQSDVSVQLSFDDRPLKLGAARIEEIAQAIATHPVNQSADSMRFGDVGLSAHLTRGVGIRGSQVTVAFAGGWGLDLSAHMADVEREIENKAREKARQAGKMPTIVLVDISRTGWSWMRGPQAMIPALQKILPSTPFAGLGVFTTSLDNPEPMQTHLAVASTVQPETTALIEQAGRALNLNAYNA